MLQVKPKPTVVERQSTKWHNLKARFRPLFGEKNVAIVEEWYNTIAPHKHREAFREIAKGILHHDVEAVPGELIAEGSLNRHRARHLILVYGSAFAPSQQERLISWLSTTSATNIDKFRDTMTSIQSIMTKCSVTKEAFVERPNSDPIVRDRFRKKIDWNDVDAKEKLIKAGYKGNPMDTNHPGDAQLPSIPGRASMKGMKIGVPSAKKPSTADPMPSVTDTAKNRNDKECRTLEGVYSVQQDGCTVYSAKKRGAAALTNAQASTRERIVATFGNPSAVGWQSTTREHIKNHGPVKHEIVKPDQHPAIARVTASLGLCVPTMKAKPKLPAALLSMS